MEAEASSYIVLYGNGNANNHLGTGFIVYEYVGIRSAFMRIEFISDKVSYIILSGCYDIVD
jgi:hypothetical protein